MSTRSQILFIENIYKNERIFNTKKGFNTKTLENEANVKLYKHSDGYPSNIVPIFKEFMSLEGSKNRINDAEYLGAWFITWLITNDFDLNENFKEPNFISDVTKGSEREIEDLKDFLGFGISKYIHYDIEYLYIFDIATKTFYIYSVHGFNNLKFKKIGAITIKNLLNLDENELEGFINTVNDSEECEWIE